MENGHEACKLKNAPVTAPKATNVLLMTSQCDEPIYVVCTLSPGLFQGFFITLISQNFSACQAPTQTILMCFHQMQLYLNVGGPVLNW